MSSSRRTKNVQNNPLFNKLFQQKQNPKPQTTEPAWLPEYQAIVQMLQAGEREQALQRCTQLRQNYPHELQHIPNLQAALLCENQRYHEGIAVWQSIANWQQNASLQSNIGRTYQLLGDLNQAHHHLSLALQLDSAHLDANLNMGVTLQKMLRRAEAIEHYEKVLQAQPTHQLARFNLATVYQDELNFQAAYQCYETILQQNPSYTNALANLVFTQHYVVPHQPDVIFERAKRLGQLYAAQTTKQTTKLPKTPHPTAPDKILHIGLVSADLQTHPVGFFLESLLKSDAVQQFNWTAYANSAVFDELSARLRPTFQAWHQVNNWSDERLIQQIQSDKIDILIDLSGLTRGNRIGVFAAQAAPLQINWLGYFSTTGLPTMQAVIADPYCVPPHEEKWFVERVWRMPHTRLCLAAPTEALPVNPLPAQTRRHFTFGCFQNLPKINDEVLATWAKIAFRLPEAHWHFQNFRLEENGVDLLNFKQKLCQFGFNLDQITFCGNTPRAEYLAKHHDIDLILDTFPYCGGTTTSEALWMGIPTLTWAREGMLARQGEQLLCAAGLADWVCHSEADYVAKAVHWGLPENWDALNHIRLNLREKVQQSPLFDAAQFGRDWCDLVREIWRDACQ